MKTLLYVKLTIFGRFIVVKKGGEKVYWDDAALTVFMRAGVNQGYAVFDDAYFSYDPSAGWGGDYIERSKYVPCFASTFVDNWLVERNSEIAKIPRAEVYILSSNSFPAMSNSWQGANGIHATLFDSKAEAFAFSVDNVERSILDMGRSLASNMQVSNKRRDQIASFKVDYQVEVAPEPVKKVSVKGYPTQSTLHLYFSKDNRDYCRSEILSIDDRNILDMIATVEKDVERSNVSATALLAKELSRYMRTYEDEIDHFISIIMGYKPDYLSERKRGFYFDSPKDIKYIMELEHWSYYSSKRTILLLTEENEDVFRVSLANVKKGLGPVAIIVEYSETRSTIY